MEEKIIVAMCESARESDLESYTSVQVGEMLSGHHHHHHHHHLHHPSGGVRASDFSEPMYYEIDPTQSQSRSSTELNTSSCSRSSSFDTRAGTGGGGGGGGSKPHKAQDGAWEAIRKVKEREGRLGVGHFRFVQRLGSGDIGSVYLAELRGAEGGGGEGGRMYYAVKVMDKRALAERNKLLRAQTEREILEALDHPFLPTLYAHLDERHLSCLVMEFCPGGDLHVLRQRHPSKRFCENAVRFYAAEVLLALEYLHMMGIVYRDLKPENVLVRDDGHIMLSDFDLSLKCSVNPVLSRLASVRQAPSSCLPSAGSSAGSGNCELPGLGCVAPCSVHPIASCLPVPRFFHLPAPSSKPKATPQRTTARRRSLPELIAEPTSVRSMSFVGTHEYLAPEIIIGEGHGSAVDWWTFGIFLFELLHGKTPFRGSDNEATLMNVVTQPLKFPASEDPNVVEYPSPAAQDLIRGLLMKDPLKRIAATRGASEVKQHGFFEGVNWALIRCAAPPEIPSPYTAPPPPHKLDSKLESVHTKHIQNWVTDHDSSEGFELF